MNDPSQLGRAARRPSPRATLLLGVGAAMAFWCAATQSQLTATEPDVAEKHWLQRIVFFWESSDAASPAAPRRDETVADPGAQAATVSAAAAAPATTVASADAIPCSHCSRTAAVCPKCRGCSQCCCCVEKFCYPVCEKKDAKSSCWCVKCEDVCIPSIKFPWQSCCEPPRCGRVRTVRVLEKVECDDCEKGYKWVIACRPAPCGASTKDCGRSDDCCEVCDQP